MKTLCTFLLVVFHFSLSSAQVIHVRDTLLMGSRFRITVVDVSEEQAEKNTNLAIAEMVRIEELISDWKPTSQISQVNQMAGKQAVVVDQEVLELTQRAIQYSKITDGAFDISFAAMERIWKFDGSMDVLPTEDEIQQAIRNVGYQNIQIDTTHQTLFLTKEGMKIGFGSIGKGYAADRARILLKESGAIAGIVDASGDISSFGSQIDGKPWRFGITNPFETDDYADIISLTNGSVTTSGDYEKYIYIGDTRYAHIINPKTGWPSTGLTGVTIVGPSAEMANAFSTSIMVLGAKKGKELLQQFPDYAGLFITDQGKIIKTKRYKSVLKTLRKTTY